MTDAGGLDLGNAIAIGAVLVAIASFTYNFLNYKFNKKSGQIKIAREEMDRILTKQQRYSQYKDDSMSDKIHYSPINELRVIDEVLLECKYFGNIFYTNVVNDENTILFYKPIVHDVVRDMKRNAQETLKHIYSQKLDEDFQEDIDRHKSLIEYIALFWDIPPRLKDVTSSRVTKS